MAPPSLLQTPASTHTRMRAHTHTHTHTHTRTGARSAAQAAVAVETLKAQPSVPTPGPRCQLPADTLPPQAGRAPAPGGPAPEGGARVKEEAHMVGSGQRLRTPPPGLWLPEPTPLWSRPARGPVAQPWAQSKPTLPACPPLRVPVGTPQPHADLLPSLHGHPIHPCYLPVNGRKSSSSYPWVWASTWLPTSTPGAKVGPTRAGAGGLLAVSPSSRDPCPPWVVLPLPCTLAPPLGPAPTHMLLWAASPLPMTPDALHTLTPKMACPSGRQPAPSLCHSASRHIGLHHHLPGPRAKPGCRAQKPCSLGNGPPFGPQRRPPVRPTLCVPSWQGQQRL
ncbi:extensin-like [Myotis myotis]|uniref:extensin-like n=1 Tax=Myotis myotis TaxID=51298 RepID=UPI00174D43B4|nr:extensin-like [Myotis myotis]